MKRSGFMAMVTGALAAVGLGIKPEVQPAIRGMSTDAMVMTETEHFEALLAECDLPSLMAKAGAVIIEWQEPELVGPTEVWVSDTGPTIIIGPRLVAGNPFHTVEGFGPKPGDYVPPNKPPSASDNTDQAYGTPYGQGARRLDPRVLWAQQKTQVLKDERQGITAQMRRAMELYRGRHWSSGRAPWKAASRINYCKYVPEQKAAILADNKPRASFGSINESDQWQADIATAAWDEWYTGQEVQASIERAITLSCVVKKAFLRLTYDPIGNHGQGTQRVTVVPGWQVYVNREATCVEDANLLMYEYPANVGDLLFQYPKLKGKLDGAPRSEGNEFEAPMLQTAPPQHVTTPNSDYHIAPYDGPIAKDGEGMTTGGVMVKEFWSRPRGPEAQTKVKKSVFNALGRPAVKNRLIEFEDGHREPLYLVLTEGNVLYELPHSVVEILKYAESLGSFKVMKTVESFDAVLEDVKVPIYPTGRRLVIVGNNVAADSCNPFAHGDFPFIECDSNKDPVRFFGQSDIDVIADMQEYLNRLYSLLLDAAILTSNPIWVIPQQTELADEEITNAPGAIIRVDPMFLKSGANRRGGPDMPAYVSQLLQFTISQIREISGLTESATGGKFKGQVSSETVSMYQEAAGVRFRQGIRNVERMMVKLGYQFVKNLGQFQGTPQLVRIKNQQGIEKSQQFIGTALTTDMSLKVKAGSMLPQSPSARFNQVQQAMGSPFPTFDMAEYYEAMEEFGVIQNAEGMMTRLEKLAKSLGVKDEQWRWPMFWAKMAAPPPKGKAKGGRTARGQNRPSGS